MRSHSCRRSDHSVATGVAVAMSPRAAAPHQRWSRLAAFRANAVGTAVARERAGEDERMAGWGRPAGRSDARYVCTSHNALWVLVADWLRFRASVREGAAIVRSMDIPTRPHLVCCARLRALARHLATSPGRVSSP